MKKLKLISFFASLLLASSTLSASNKELTIEEMLNKSLSKSNNIEHQNYQDFIPSEYLDSEYTAEQQKMLKKIYLFYLKEIKSNGDDFELTSNELEKTIKPIFDEGLSKDNRVYLSIVNDKNEKFELKNNKVYYVDLENKKLYSKDLEDFAGIDIKNMYRIILNIEYNRIVIIEPKKYETSYLTIVNLSQLEKVQFSDLEGMIKHFFKVNE